MPFKNEMKIKFLSALGIFPTAKSQKYYYWGKHLSLISFAVVNVVTSHQKEHLMSPNPTKGHNLYLLFQ